MGKNSLATGAKKAPNSDLGKSPVLPGTTEDFTTTVTGEADFIKLAKDRFAIRFYLRGNYTAASGVQFQRILVKGAPGRDVKKLKDLGEVHAPGAGKSEWSIEPRHLEKEQSKNKKVLTFSAKSQDYIVRLEFEYKKGSDTYRLVRTWWISTLAEPTPARKSIEADEGAEPEQRGTVDIESLVGTGTFYGGQKIALYDFETDFTAGPTRVEIYAGPSSNPTSRVYDEPIPATVGTCFDTGIVGRYNGVSDTYYFKLVLTEGNNTHSMTKVFTNILENQGSMIPMSMWNEL